MIFMNNKETLAGKLYYPRTQDLGEIRHRAHILCQEYNSLDDYDDRRYEILEEVLGSIGKDFYMQGPIQFNYGKNIFIGDDFYANFNFTILDDGEVNIGDRVMIAPNVSLLAGSHPLPASERVFEKDGKIVNLEYGTKINIGDNVWIGGSSTVVGDVTIGEGAVIGAGSVVIKDIPPNCVAFGNPCKFYREITEKDSMKKFL